MLSYIAVGGQPPEGDWLITDRQTAGRGRMGRVWQDGIGNFMGSTLVELRGNYPPAHSLALMMGLCLHRVLKGWAGHICFRIKWPNDIVVNGAKVAGILLERHGDFVVIGVGVNLISAPQFLDRATTSLAALGVKVSRNSFAGLLSEDVFAAIGRWRSGEWPTKIIDEWTARAHPLGTVLTLTDGPHAGLTGAFDGLERDGSLRLRTQEGAIMTIHAGELRMADLDPPPTEE